MSAQTAVASADTANGDAPLDIASDRLEGAEAIRDFIKPGMPMRNGAEAVGGRHLAMLARRTAVRGEQDRAARALALDDPRLRAEVRRPAHAAGWRGRRVMPSDPAAVESDPAEARHARTLERVRALAPAINVLLHQGHARAEVARTLRTQADLVLGQAEEVARALRQAAAELEVGAPAGSEGGS